MTTATYHLANLGVTITFPKTNLGGRFVSMETYAIWQAQAFLKHGKAEPGCVVARIDGDGMTVADHLCNTTGVVDHKSPAMSDNRGGDARAGSGSHTGSAEPLPASDSAAPECFIPQAKPLEEFGVVLPVGTVWLMDGYFGAVAEHPHGKRGTYYGLRGSSDFNRSSLADRTGSGRFASDWRTVTPTEAAAWLRANGHASVADRIDGDKLVGARVFKWFGGGATVWLEGTTYGECMYHLRGASGSAWEKSGHSLETAERYGVAEITGTPAAKEALASLARWMENNDG